MHEENKSNNASPQSQKHKFKKVEKINPPIKGYNIYDFDTLVYTFETRPEQTLENLLES